MDRKELCKRWVMAQIEPSLFYIPFNTVTDDYSTYLRVNVQSSTAYSYEDSFTAIYIRWTASDCSIQDVNPCGYWLSPVIRENIKKDKEIVWREKVIARCTSRQGCDIYINNFPDNTDFKYIDVSYSPYGYSGWTDLQRYQHIIEISPSLTVTYVENNQTKWSKRYKHPATYLPYNEYVYVQYNRLDPWAYDIKNKKYNEYPLIMKEV